MRRSVPRSIASQQASGVDLGTRKKHAIDFGAGGTSTIENPAMTQLSQLAITALRDAVAALIGYPAPSTARVLSRRLEG